MSDPVEEIRERLNVAKPLGANHVAFLLAEVDRLREDKERLDWLETAGVMVCRYADRAMSWRIAKDDGDSYEAHSLREGIDAARQKEDDG